MRPSHRIIVADVLDGLASLEAGSVRCCVTSPPYWGLRDYGVAGQIGLEATPEAYIERMVAVFREVRRVLRPDGVLFLNIGDSYAASGPAGGAGKQHTNVGTIHVPVRKPTTGLKPKDLVGIPWMLAFALRADGWYLRQDIIWAKPNPMPESVRDRCTKAHEYLFLLSKGPRYHFDSVAIREPSAKPWSNAKFSQNGKNAAAAAADPNRFRTRGIGDRSDLHEQTGRNRRSVWTIAPKPFKGAHFATFPPALVEPCILAGSAVGDTVLDPFGGSGTTAEVARKHGRNAVLIELNPEYAAMAERRLAVLL